MLPDVLHPIPVEQIAKWQKTAVVSVSVIVPCCGQLEYTRLCVSSLLRHSRRPYELIFIDLESLDGTGDYLTGLLAAASVPVRVLRLCGCAGFAEAFNRGIALATGEYVVLLSNDTIVTPYWLEHLVALADSLVTIGVVGAMSNCPDSPQSVGVIPYRLTAKPVQLSEADIGNGRATIDTEPVDRFAERWAGENSGQWFEADRLSTFCLMFKRTALNHALPLEPSSFFAINEDLMFRRIQATGSHIVCCRDLYIHRFGSRPSV